MPQNLSANPNNRGGGRLSQWDAVPTAGGHRLRLHGPVGVAVQVQLHDPRYSIERGPEVNGPHHLTAPGPGPSRSTLALLELLGRVLTLLPCTHPVDFAVALDWYKHTADSAARDGLRPTTFGGLAQRGKYAYKQENAPGKRAAVAKSLSADIKRVVRAHAILTRADVVVAPPGHDALRPSFGTVLAEQTAKALGLPFVPASCWVRYRTAAKDLEPDERAAAVHGKFYFNEDLTKRRTIIVDDFYTSGVTAAETARAARASGAHAVAVITAVRTLRSPGTGSAG